MRPTDMDQAQQAFIANLRMLLGPRYSRLRTLLARHLGVKPYVVSRYLSGVKALPPPAVLDRIAGFFGLPDRFALLDARLSRSRACQIQDVLQAQFAERACGPRPMEVVDITALGWRTAHRATATAEGARPTQLVATL